MNCWRSGSLAELDLRLLIKRTIGGMGDAGELRRTAS